MALTPLNDDQRRSIEALVDARRIEAVPVDPDRAAKFLRQAQARIEELSRITAEVVRFGVAYDAAHDIGEALLASYGYRTKSGPGQHEALGRFLKAVLVAPPGDRAARQFDRLRTSRNRDRYEAQPIAEADCTRAERAARDLFASALDRGVKR
ncbi:MAG TPA: hypothetical protein VFQ74_02030 [Pseudolysinimonas sp.]|nr:hypothetical protein [Pseudolysinimonas sp.]